MNKNLSFKVIVNNSETAIKMLNKLFDKGYRWPDGTTVIANEASYSFVSKDGFIYTIKEQSESETIWNTIEYKELNLLEVNNVKTDFVNLTESLNAFIMENGVMIGSELIEYSKLEDILSKRQKDGSTI